MIRELAQAEAHVWLCFYDEIVDERLHAAYRALLSEAERNQQQRFHFARDRIRYLVTRALVRTVLSRYLPMAPEDWTFEANAYGRPHIGNPGFAHCGLYFNVSHTHSLIAVAVTHGREIGVDVENVRDRDPSIDIAHRFFAPQEVAALTALPSSQQHDRFFEYWTFKESYIKARGMGLSIALDKFSFRYPSHSTVELFIDPELNDDPQRWHFWQLRPTPQYLLALCAERRSTQIPSWVVRKVVPLESEHLLVPMVTRASPELFSDLNSHGVDRCATSPL